MTARRTPAVDEAAGVPAPEVPDFEVVGDQLVCHALGDLRLSLVVPMATYERYQQINAAAVGWADQIAAWKAEIMPVEVVEAVERESARDFAAGLKLARKWSWGLDKRLGEALAS